MKTLIEYLSIISEWHDQHGTLLTKNLAAGLTPNQVTSMVEASRFQFRLPDSVVALYGWANGTSGFEIVTPYSMHDLDTALRCGANIQRRARDIDVTSIRWLPILHDLNDDFGGAYYVQCSAQSTHDGPVYFWGHDERNSAPMLKFEGVFNMFRTFALCMSKGAYRRTDDGMVARTKLVREITRKCNPNLTFARERSRDD